MSSFISFCPSPVLNSAGNLLLSSFLCVCSFCTFWRLLPSSSMAESTLRNCNIYLIFLYLLTPPSVLLYSVWNLLLSSFPCFFFSVVNSFSLLLPSSFVAESTLRNSNIYFIFLHPFPPSGLSWSPPYILNCLNLCNSFHSFIDFCIILLLPSWGCVV